MFFALLLSFLMAYKPVYAANSWQSLTWTTSDGVKLVGLYEPPSRSGARTWILLHGLGSNKGEWQDFGGQLTQQGDGVLIYDARGHEDSRTRKDGSVIDYRQFDRADWSRTVDDLESAVQELKKRQSSGSSLKIALGGASLGANVALIYAARHPDKIATVLLLSPGYEYAGLKTEEAFKSYSGRLLMAASPSDQYAFDTLTLYRHMRNDSAMTVLQGQGSEHGVHMLHGKFLSDLLAWTAGGR